MKIAVSSQGATISDPVDPRFGRARMFMVYDDQADTWECIDNVQNLEAAQGAGIQSAATVVNAGAGVLISGHCGPKAFAALSKANVAVYTIDGGSVGAAVAHYRAGSLQRSAGADVEGHW